MRRYSPLFAVLILTAGLGCQGEPATPPMNTNEFLAQPRDSTSPEKEITLEVKSWEEVQDWVKTQSGKVVVIDGWSTSCPPCLAEFPNFVALQNKYPEQVSCASFSLDYTKGDQNPPPELRERILTILRDKLHATTTNFLSSDKDEDVTVAMGISAIPVAFVYNAEGELVKKFTNDDGEYGNEGYTYEKDIIPFVEQLVEGEK